MLIGSFKWHQLCDYMIYEMTLFHFVTALMPYSKNSYEEFFIFNVCYQAFFFYYTGSGLQIIFIVLIQICWMEIPNYLILEESFTFLTTFVHFLYHCGLFWILSLFAMILQYILNLH